MTSTDEKAQLVEQKFNVRVNSMEDKKDDLAIVREFDTEYGPLRATCYGDTNKPMFITYHDVGSNHTTCFRQFFKNAPKQEEILQQFSVIHLDAPGQHIDASEIPAAIPWLDFDKLTDQIETVVKEFKIKRFIGMGAGAGGYIMLNFAVRHPEYVQGLILLGATCRKCGWIEWAGKWMSGLQLWYLNRNTSWQNYFLERWFSPKTIKKNLGLVNTYVHEMERINANNLYKFLQGFHRRRDLSEELAKIADLDMLMFVGDNTMLYNEASHILGRMGANTDWVKPRDCGLLITAERPEMMLQPIRSFLQGLRYFVGKKPQPQNQFQ
mmetsp:Transcript_29835/g.58435  ORF Transcript_29835/g.58435 Transcript_29835/m.58435 type:complete len:324 (-) Transcript_29835:410-1381(-)|eukprot:CAMPEP_0175121920 /NCGR_PEP_ID=MMETSP0087-20121206/1434_1 /TAXON_ID=136419 /ORGANISM="Unknown Unknown, Strain D1" /LENGTH=323 /DNA_ID=CAMNT_0016403511 /DNA_START=38 /DNA_END=1009 /DNA_ORIENTATION=+